MSRERRPPPSSLPFFRRRSTLWLVGAVLLLGVAGILNCVSKHGSASHTAGTATPATVTSVTASRTAAPSGVAPNATAGTASTPSVAAPEIHPDPARLQSARVVRVVDGDTIIVELAGKQERIRYYGIDTPERGQACFSEATDRNNQLIDGTVRLLPDARNRDHYGRLLRYVFDAQGVSVDARLVAEGYARAWRQDGAYRSELIAAEDQMHAARAGCLWKGH